MIDPEIVAIFLEEATDILHNWEKECLTLEKNIDHPDFNGLFRCAHNIKGSAKSVGLESLGQFVHEVEDVINLLRNGEIKLIPKILEFLLDAQALLAKWVEELNKDVNYVPNTKSHSMKAVAIKDFAKKKTGEASQIISKDFGTIAVEVGIEQHQVEKAIKLQNRKIGEIMVDEGIISEKEKIEILEKQKIMQKKAGVQKTDESIRISANKIDRLIQLIGELSIQQSIITHAKKNKPFDSPACGNAISLASKINSEIQTNALSLRMLPIEGLFQRLERIIRDLARSLKKQVEIEIEGSNVELDKTIIEKVTDPLIHIVRNAIDHGVESTQERVKQQKNPTALVRIAAIQDATGVVLIIEDDGKGLDREKIKKKAIEEGLIKAEAHLSDKELNLLILEPGFSTADKITDLSGRGVGMDVVKRTLDSVGGSIDIFTEKFKGTTFSISLPTSLSIIDALVVMVKGQRYIIPLLELSEVLDLNSYNLERTSTGETMFNLRGKVVPVQKLADYFPHPGITGVLDEHDDPNSKNNDNFVRPALIIEMNQSKVAFEIDKIVSQQQVVVKPLNDKLSTLPGYCGGSIMADGEAGMIVTLRYLAQKYFEKYSNN